MVVCLAGAGFSKWAAGLPVARDLFDWSIVPFGPREEAKLRDVRTLKALWDKERPDGHAEEFVDYALGHDERSAAAVQWYVVRRLSEPYIWREWQSGRWRRHVLMIDESRKWKRPGVTEAQRFLAQILGGYLSGVVTTNYDLLIEYALGTRGFNYGSVGERLYGRGPYPLSQWRNPVVLRGELPLAKVHGSISWDDEGRYTDGRRGLSGRALIVPPGPGKEPPEELAHQWELAGAVLRRTTRLVVFGFAFNDYDRAFLVHLGRHGEGLRNVLLSDVAPNERSAQRLWPRARVESVLPPPEGEARVVEWLRG